MLTAILILLGLVLVLLAARRQKARGAAAPTGTPAFQNDSRHKHDAMPVQTWREFLHETRRQHRNSLCVVKLGDSRSGHEIGIVGESFYLPELQWVRSTFGGSEGGQRVRFPVYLIPEPENPHSPNGNAVRVESPRGGTIGHLSRADADAYAPVFKALHMAQRIGTCQGVAVGGTGRKPNIGVWITSAHPAWLAELLTEAEQPARPRRTRTAPEQPPTDQPF